jgi:hypothetical protein
VHFNLKNSISFTLKTYLFTIDGEYNIGNINIARKNRKLIIVNKEILKKMK